MAGFDVGREAVLVISLNSWGGHGILVVVVVVWVLVDKMMPLIYLYTLIASPQGPYVDISAQTSMKLGRAKEIEEQCKLIINRVLDIIII